MKNLEIKDKDLKFLKGKIEIFDKNGNLYFTTSNLVLTASRAAIIQILFNDDKVADTINALENQDYVEKLPTSNNIKKLICGFSLGNGGANVNVSPTTIKVPSHKDNFVNGTFSKVPFISAENGIGGTITIKGNSSYENLDEIINTSSALENPSISIASNDNIVVNSNGAINSVRYFFANDTNYYCKAFDIINNKCNYINTTGEIDYVIKLPVDSWDAVGETISEVGLVLADCTVSSDNKNIIAIDDSTVHLATRATFSPISLATDLLSSFTIKYHIYI